MLVLPHDGRLGLIFQNDHASLSGRLARAWCSDYIAHQSRRAEVLEAVEGHDAGWAEADRAGVFDPETGRPATFLELPEERYPPLWRASIEEASARGPLAGYLVARHFASLAGPPESPSVEGGAAGAMETFRAEAERIMKRLARAIGPPAGPGPYLLAAKPLDNDFRFLQLNDLLSLVVCGGHAEGDLLAYLRASRLGGDPVRAELAEPFRLRIAPWFFEPERIEDAVAIHTIADRAYQDPEALARAIGEALVTYQPVVLEPL